MSGEPNKPGRKPLPDADRRKHWDLMLTAAEIAAIERAAGCVGAPPRVWARNMLLLLATGQLPERQPAARPAPAREETQL